MLEHVLMPGVRLRLFEEVDADELYRLIEDNRAYLAPWMPWAANQTLGDTSEFIRSTRRQLADNNGIQAALTIDGRIAGSVGMHAISWNNATTGMGYWLAEKHQGRGAITAAVRAFTEHAFALGLNRMEIGAAAGNARSCAVPERLGFKREGVLRQLVQVSGRHQDIAVYSVLAGEWPPAGATR